MDSKGILNRDLEEFASHFPFQEQIRRKTFLITGATGLLGSLLVKTLLKLNRVYGTEVKIIALARNPQKIFNAEEFEWVVQDIATPIKIEDNPDYIFHCAAATSSQFMISHPVDVLKTIFNGTDNVLHFAKECRSESIVFLSSIESYGSFSSAYEIHEDESGYINPLNARSCYPLGKKVAENLCFSYFSEFGLPVKIARLTQTFGPGVSKDDKRVFAQFARSAIAGKPIVLHTEGCSSKPYCYTMDALSALFYILLKGEDGQAYNVANESTYTSIKEMARLVAERFAHSSVTTVLSDNAGYAPATFSRLSASKLVKLGWQPKYPLEEMFSRLIVYMTEEK